MNRHDVLNNIGTRESYCEHLMTASRIPLICTVKELLDYIAKAEAFIKSNPMCSYFDVWEAIDPPERGVVSAVLDRLTAEGKMGLGYIRSDVSLETGAYVYWYQEDYNPILHFAQEFKKREERLAKEKEEPC